MRTRHKILLAATLPLAGFASVWLWHDLNHFGIAPWDSEYQSVQADKEILHAAGFTDVTFAGRSWSPVCGDSEVYYFARQRPGYDGQRDRLYVCTRDVHGEETTAARKPLFTRVTEVRYEPMTEMFHVLDEVLADYKRHQILDAHTARFGHP